MNQVGDITNKPAHSSAISCKNCSKTFTTKGSYGRHIRSRCKGSASQTGKELMRNDESCQGKIHRSRGGDANYPLLKNGLDNLLQEPVNDTSFADLTTGLSVSKPERSFNLGLEEEKQPLNDLNLKSAYIEYLIGRHTWTSRVLKQTRKDKAKILGKRRNHLAPEERPRHHVCFGKRYSRPWSSWSSLRLRKCTPACHLRADAKKEYLQLCWEINDTKLDRSKLHAAILSL